MTPSVVAVARDADRRFSKPVVDEITLVTGIGIEGDAHAGVTMKKRIRYQPTQVVPNVRQVHLLQSELFHELRGQGFEVAPGELGENITTVGVDLLSLPLGTRISFGNSAAVELTGLRNPCRKIDRFQDGLQVLMTDRDANGKRRRKVGVMAVVVADGTVRAGDAVRIEVPAGPTQPLQVV